jgi:hypothetical protein
MNEEYVKIIRECLVKMEYNHLEITQGENEGEYCFGNISISDQSDRKLTQFLIQAKDPEGFICFSGWYYSFRDAAIAGVVQLIIQDLEGYFQEKVNQG